MEHLNDKSKKKSVITTICVGLAFIAIGFTIMFAVLRPQDKYEKVMATVIDSYYWGNNSIVTVEYLVNDKTYTNEFELWMTHYNLTEKVLVRYNVDNPNKLRSRRYTFYMSLTIELLVIGIISITGLLVIREKVKFNSQAEAKRCMLKENIFSISAVVICLLIPIVGALSPLIYYSTKIFGDIETAILFLPYI